MNEELQIIQQVVDQMRTKYFDWLNAKVFQAELEMIQAKDQLGSMPTDHHIQAGIVSIIEEMLAVNALVNGLKHGGKAKSLILINSFGQAVDLLNIKELKENDLINSILDNYKTQKP